MLKILRSSKFPQILFLIILLFISGILITTYWPHKNWNNEKIVFSLNSRELSSAYMNNPETANAIYLNNFIEVSGKVTSIDENIIIIDNLIVCSLDSSKKSTNNFVINSIYKVKGRCIGFDDLFNEVRLDYCSLSTY
tara:strand:+ start:4560 stop:4970 length:411 start_codon:yes stop_codon:yes gene_type:complete